MPFLIVDYKLQTPAIKTGSTFKARQDSVFLFGKNRRLGDHDNLIISPSRMNLQCLHIQTFSLAHSSAWHHTDPSSINLSSPMHHLRGDCVEKESDRKEKASLTTRIEEHFPENWDML